MNNSEKFAEVFGEKTRNQLIEGMKSEELTMTDVLLWLMSEYTKEPKEAPKKRGRKKKEIEA